MNGLEHPNLPSRRRPRNPRRLAAALAVAVLAGAPAAGQQEPIEQLEELARTLRGQPVWSAVYHQEYVAAGMDEGEQADGRVWVAWPDRALFRTGDPVIRLMGLDHRQVRLVDLDVPSCEDHQLSDDEWSRIPLAVVLDPRAAIDRFTLLATGHRGFALVPREPGGIARVEVELAADGLPERVVVLDPQGSSNRLDFAAWRPATEPPGGAWIPAAPPGLSCSGAAPDGEPAESDDRGRLRR